MISFNCKNLILNEFISSFKNFENFNHYLDKNSTDILNLFNSDPTGIDVIPYHDINSIKQSTSSVILVDLFGEGFHISHCFLHYPKNKRYIFFTNGWWDKNQFDFNLDYELIHWFYYLYHYIKHATDSNTIDFYQDRNYYFDIDKEFIFSATIGIQKPWRNQFVNILQTQLNFDNYILNYNGKELGKSSREVDLNLDFNEFDPLKNIFQYYTISSSIPIGLYNKSKLLLVAETCMYEHNEFHLTEKTVKALLTGIPFIICGSYKFLEHLRSLGFKTFNDIWSEEYDNISDTEKRMLAISDLLNQISQMSWDQQTIDKLKIISYHNTLQLLNVNSIMKKQFESIIKTFKDYKI